MEIHKPKAAHSLREFLIEIGTIICGILIALGLEQVVSNLDWNRRVVETRQAVGLELGENLGKMDNRMQLERCLDQRLDALADIVDHAAKAGALPPLAKPRAPPNTSWGSGVWASAISAQTVSHLPADELRRYGRFYSLLALIAAAESQEQAAWTTLFELAGPGRPFDLEDARTYRRAIGEAHQQNALIAGYSVRERQLVDSHHLQFDHKVFAERTALLKVLTSTCGEPAGMPPARYGAAPAVGFSTSARARASPADK